jgi:CBS domain containing-hemolysin-like protein
VLERQANDSYLDELVDELKGTTESYLANNYSHKRMAFTACFALTLLLSLLVFFAELATFAPFLEPANLLALLSRSGIAGLVLNTCLAGYVAYVITHTVFRIRIYKAFALHRGHSSASSLLFTAINLARVSYPLCFNYLQMAGLPDSAFLRFFGELTLHRGIFLVFPLLMLLFAGLNLFDVFEKVIGCLGLGSFAFDAE